MNRRSFALGFGAGILSLLVVAAVLLLIVSTPAGPAVAPSSPRAQVTSPASPPAVGPGETWLSDVELSSGDVRTTDGPLRDVTASGSGVRLTPDGLRADRLDLVATLPFETTAEQIGDGIELYPDGELTGLRRTVEILGRQVPIEATGRVRAVDGQLVIEPETVDLGSFEWLDRVASAAVRTFVTIRHTVTGIPDGMRLDDVEVHQDGFRVELSGTDVRIGS
ncbi:MAG: LmeA family phospholipid-binding protein [Dermatophilaceae bacterium]|nr:DUF2993 domain-containing protein [Intrasporangiaceae bacterium]